jgi:hypothetical protein
MALPVAFLVFHCAFFWPSSTASLLYGPSGGVSGIPLRIFLAFVEGQVGLLYGPSGGVSGIPMVHCLFR